MANTQQKPKITVSRLLKLAVILVAIFSITVAPLQRTLADSYDAQIKELQKQAADFQDQAASYRQQADTYQNQVNILNAEKARLQTQIDLNTAKIAELTTQIADTEKKIEDQKTLLGNSLVALYLDNSVSPLEVLASSKSISDYIDKQEYRDTIRAKLQDSITTIKKLKDTQTADKKSAEGALADQQAQRTELATRESEQATLLAQTQGQEAAYQNLAKQKNSQAADLRAAQALANLKWGGLVNYVPAGGGYPAAWANAPLDAYLDDWGMFTRECVSFTAFKVAASGRPMPYGFGNAIQWPGAARSRGISVTTTPKTGDVAIWPVGYYGHAMYVYSVGGDGSIFIGEYNYDWTGRYSERVVTQSTWQAQGFQFIHF